MRDRVVFLGILGVGAGLAAGTGCDLVQGLKPATVVETGGGGQGGGGEGGAGATTSSMGGTGGTTATACEPGTSIPCYTGMPPESKDVSQCKGGTRACKADGSGYEDVCEGEVVPKAETCADTADEDCDMLDCARWAVVFGDENEQAPLGIETDAAGNVYVLGTFKGSVQFEGAPFVSAGERDLFVVKLDPTGTPLWSRQFGNALDQASAELAVDPLGNVILTGKVTGTLNFGGANIQSKDIFLAKLDAGGNHVWSKGFQATSTHGSHVGAAPDGSVVLWASFLGSANFEGSALTASVDYKAVLVSFAPGGAHSWEKAFVSTGADSLPGTSYNHTYARSIEIDGSGNITIAGLFGGKIINFGGRDILETAVGGGGFLVRFDKLGNHAWSLQQWFAGNLSVDPVGAPTLAALDDVGGFAPCVSAPVQKYSSTGVEQWTNPYACPDQGKDFKFVDVDADVQGNVVVAFVPPDTPYSVGGDLLAAIGTQDILLAKLDGAGNHLWSRRFGAAGAAQESPLIATAPNGDIVMAAQVSGAIDVGTGPIPTKGKDLLVARFAP